MYVHLHTCAFTHTVHVYTVYVCMTTPGMQPTHTHTHTHTCNVHYTWSSGEFFFDKAVSGFLRELFVRWREAGCNHDVTIVFFWRLHYDPTTASIAQPLYMHTHTVHSTTHYVHVHVHVHVVLYCVPLFVVWYVVHVYMYMNKNSV